jgi:hypothetical protein
MSRFLHYLPRPPPLIHSTHINKHLTLAVFLTEASGEFLLQPLRLHPQTHSSCSKSKGRGGKEQKSELGFKAILFPRCEVI